MPQLPPGEPPDAKGVNATQKRPLPVGSERAKPSRMAALLLACCILGSFVYLRSGGKISFYAPSTTKADYEPLYDQGRYKAAAKELILQGLRDPRSAAEFSGLKVIPATGNQSTIVCGSVNARNGFGGMSGPQRFIAGGVVYREEEIGSENMDTLWNVYCLAM